MLPPASHVSWSVLHLLATAKLSCGALPSSCLPLQAVKSGSTYWNATLWTDEGATLVARASGSSGASGSRLVL